MKRQLGLMTSLLFLCTSALLWVGCSSNRIWDNSPLVEDQQQTTYDGGVQDFSSERSNPTPQAYAPINSTYQPSSNRSSQSQLQNLPQNSSQYNAENDQALKQNFQKYLAESSYESEQSPYPDTQEGLEQPSQYQQDGLEQPSQYQQEDSEQSPQYPQEDREPYRSQYLQEDREQYRSRYSPKDSDSEAYPSQYPYEKAEEYQQQEADFINRSQDQFVYPPESPATVSCQVDSFCRPLPQCRYPSSNELVCRDGIIVSAQNQSMCLLGEQYPLIFDVNACDNVCDVIVTTHLPQGVSYVRSQPEARVEGNKLTWNFGAMKKGECRPAKAWLKCECEGEQCACFCASAVPMSFCSLLCAKPLLSCQKSGPQEVCPGDCVNYTITVANKGTCTAEDVVVTDNIPDGLEHSSGLRTLTYKLGCLGPCEVKKINLTFTAVKRGKMCNSAVVTACNADSVSCQWCTDVCLECVDIVKVGPKEQQIGKNADYQITVTNTGDKPLTDLIVTDTAPNMTSVVSANGATVNGNQIIWRVRELKPGAKVSFNLTLTTCTPGCFTNNVHVTDYQGCEACAEFTTRWRGRPALNVSICDTENPICVGEPTSYCITVVNQGSEADNNVAVTVRFPKEVAPVCASGDSDATISNQVVSFAPVNDFGARQTLRYRVDARGKEAGDARIVVEVTSESVKTPIMQQESTIVN